MKARVGFIVLTFVTLYTPRATADTFGNGADQFDIEFVAIGNPNNSDDTTGVPNPAGKVEYSYRMGKFEVSEDMINKANSLGGLGITHDNRGISKPATSVTWFEAASFVNWLNKSQGHQEAYKFDASGNFELWSSAEAWQKGGENLFRHKDTFYFLPSIDEWYKSAFYAPDLDVYYDYATGSDTVPTAIASGTAEGTAIYDQNYLSDPADIKLAGGLSPYGTVGQSGNVWEWNETELDLVNDRSAPNTHRVTRGGDWRSSLIRPVLTAQTMLGAISREPSNNLGFRVASVPEPGTGLLVAFAAGALLVWRKL